MDYSFCIFMQKRNRKGMENEWNPNNYKSGNPLSGCGRYLFRRVERETYRPGKGNSADKPSLATPVEGRWRAIEALSVAGCDWNMSVEGMTL